MYLTYFINSNYLLKTNLNSIKQEKEVQDQILKENQLIVKEIALKYTTDSETWNRQKQKLLEKEKLVMHRHRKLRFLFILFFIFLAIYAYFPQIFF